MEDDDTVYRLGRDLTNSELEVVIEHLGDYIQWYDIIEGVISNHVEIEKIDHVEEEEEDE